MTGSLQTKNGKYYAVINLIDTNGKRRPKWISTGLDIRGNKKRAEQFLKTKIKEYESNTSATHADILFSDYLSYWLSKMKPSLAYSTYKSYEDILLTHIIPYFKEKNISIYDLSLSDIQAYIDDKFKNGRTDGLGGLSAKTVKYHSVLIKKSLKFALKEGLISTNPAEFIVIPKIQKYEASFYNEEQINKLLSSIKSSNLYYLIYFTILFGLRRSEVLGLRWSCINFLNKSLTINHTVVSYKGTVRKDQTKNKTSNRTYPLSDDIISILKAIQKEEAANRSIYNDEYIDNDYIFKWPNGKPYSPDFVTSKFSKLLRQYNLPHIRFHDLRHSCASLLVANGFQLKDIQEWLGHADIQTTANIYAHLDIERKSKITSSMQNTLNFNI